MDSKAYILTHSDLLYLTETIDKATQLNKIVVSTDVFISMIRNCLELVSRLINPDMARQWEDLIAHRVCYETEMDSSKTKSSKKLLFCQVYETVSCIFLELPWTVDNGGEHWQAAVYASGCSLDRAQKLHNVNKEHGYSVFLPQLAWLGSIISDLWKMGVNICFLER